MHVVQNMYKQSIMEEIWRLSEEIELARQKEPTFVSDNLVQELEGKFAEYIVLQKAVR